MDTGTARERRTGGAASAAGSHGRPLNAGLGGGRWRVLWLVLLWGGCDSYDADLLAPLVKLGGVMGPRDDAGAPMAMLDAAACLPSSGSAETCNGEDDDCDGEVDEGASAQCALDNAISACLPGGLCAVAECREGFLDCNATVAAEAGDGCETAASDALCGCGQVCDEDAGAPTAVDVPGDTSESDPPSEPDGPDEPDEATPEDCGSGASPTDAPERCNELDDDCDGETDEGDVCEIQACINAAPSYRGAACDRCMCERCAQPMGACQLSPDATRATLCGDLLECYAVNPCTDCYDSGNGPCVAQVNLASGGESETDSSAAATACQAGQDNACGVGLDYRACLDANCATECPN